MRRAPERCARAALAAALVALCLGAGAVAPERAEAAPSGGQSAPSTDRDEARGGGGGAKSTDAVPVRPTPLSPGAGKELGASGQVDPISGLGIRNPLCDRPGQILERRTRLSCQLNGTPESAYPASNYGFDVFIDTGIDAPSGTFAKGLVMMLNGIWLGLIFVLKLVLALLGLAFGLNPFTDSETMSRLSTATSRLYARVTDPWLGALVVCAGIWFAYKGLIRRELVAGVAGTLAAIALLVIGLWVVHAPRASVGQAARLSDELALAVIAAPQSGSVSRPAGSFAEAMSGVWAQLVEVPFAGLNFSDVEWALGAPPPEAIERADTKLCADVGALALVSILSRYGAERAEQTCATYASRRYGRPKRVIDLYLRSSPGSPARRELWKFFDKDEADTYKAKVAAQGGDGVLTRLSMLALFAIGLLGAIALLAWLAIRLFTQAAIGFVLLLCAPLALFFPLLGDSGRKAFKTWGLTLLGAIAAKVIYAAFLSVVLAGMSILGSGGGAVGFLLSSAFAWSVFLKRAELVGWLSIGDAERSAAGGKLLGKLLAFSLGRRAMATVGGLARGAGRGATGWAAERRADGAQATRQSARSSLRGSARALAEQRYAEAQRTVGEFELRHGRGQAGGGAAASPRQAAGGERPEPRGRGTPPSGAERERYERARALIGRADRNREASGERWSARDLARYGGEDEALLRGSRDPAEHAHRVGLGHAQFESLRGAERERAAEQIEAARRRDLQRLKASEAPGRIAGRGRLAAERHRQRSEGGALERREHLRRLRRERREPPASRRGLSRGA